MNTPIRSPWGKVDYVVNICDDIVQVSTPRHGGMKLSRKFNSQMPPYMRNSNGWYEEDCEWSKVAVIFPQCFDQTTVEIADKTLRNWFPYEYMALTRSVLTTEESYILRKEAFKKASENKFVVKTAWGSWHAAVPEGMIGVYAERESDGATGYWMVPKTEYTWPFVVDETKHTRVDSSLFDGKTTKEV